MYFKINLRNRLLKIKQDILYIFQTRFDTLQEKMHFSFQRLSQQDMYFSNKVIIPFAV